MTETGKPVPEVAEGREINETTLASWVSRAKRAEKATPEDQDALTARPTAENAALHNENKGWAWSAMSPDAAWSRG
ncbi:transposase [Streptomyces caniscabiei]|uniref:transposase n=1 Tax=Streptomyces caniscabiei TaxID=2746961 RepID=UPI000B327A8B|nr:transposase [Streptomyces caniscabiei]